MTTIAVEPTTTQIDDAELATFIERPRLIRRPTRYNAAGRCIWCWEAACISPECRDAFAKSFWQVCPECDGVMFDHEKDELCYCAPLSGMIQASPTHPDAI